MRVSIGAWLCIGILAACGASTVTTTPTEAASATLDARGGTVTLEGVELSVPPGALDGPTLITLRRTEEKAQDGTQAYSPLYRFEPSGLAFHAPATVRIAHARGAAAPGLFWTAQRDPTFYERLEGKDDGATLEANVDHFSGGFVGAEACRPTAACTLGASCERRLATCAMTHDAHESVRRCTCVDGAYTCKVDDEKTCAARDGGTDAESDAATDAPAVPAEVAPGTPEVICTRRIHGLGRELLYSVATAPDGRIAVCGALNGSTATDFGAGPVTAQVGFVAVYDAACNLLWSQTASAGTFSVHLDGVAFDTAGNLLVAGLNVVAKFDTSYKNVYTKTFNGAKGQRVDGMGVDAEGNVYLGGTFAGTLDFGGGPLVAPSDGGYRTAVYLAKLDSMGAHVWSRVFAMSSAGDAASAGNFQMTTLNVGETGDVVLSGVAPSGGGIDLGGGPLVSSGTPLDYYRWAARLTTDGTHVWSKPFAVHYMTTGSMPNGDVLVAAALRAETIDGPVNLSVDFGNGPVAGNAAVARLAGPDGAARWSKGFPVMGRAVSTAPGGFLFPGYFRGAADLGCGTLTSAGESDLVFARLSSDGQCLYSMRFGDTKDQFLAVAASAKNGASVLAGSYHGTITIGTTTLPNDDTPATPDSGEDTEDAFFAVFSK